MKQNSLAMAVALGLLASPAPAADFTFTEWSTITNVPPLSAVGTLAGVNVTLSGAFDVVTNNSSAQFASSDFSPPLTNSDAVHLLLGIPGPVLTHTISFGGAGVVNPVMHIHSLGSTLTFNTTNITRVSGSSGFTVSNNQVFGLLSDPEGDQGTIQFNETFTSISFTGVPMSPIPFSLDNVFVQIGVPVATPCIIACPPNLTVHTDDELCTASGVMLGPPTLTGDCEAAIVTSNAPASFPKGTTTVTWTVIDAAGNASTCSQTITVVDNEPPQFTCPANVTVPFNSVPLPVTTATDNCGSATVNSADVAAGTCPIVITRTYTVTDDSTNTNTCQQIITVNNLFAADAILWHQPLARPGLSDDTDPSAGGTLKYRFKLGSTIPVQVKALGCDGDVTANANVAGTVEVLGDSNCETVADGNAQLIDITGTGSSGGVMDKMGGCLKFNLDTHSLPTTTQCYILRVTVTDTSTGETKSEEVLLQAK